MNILTSMWCLSRFVIKELVKLHYVYRKASGGQEVTGAETAAVFDPFAKMSSFLKLLPTAFADKDKQRK